MLLSAATPQYDDEDWDYDMDANNPNNFADEGDDDIYV